MSEQAILDIVADAVADGRPVDWTSADAAAVSGQERRLLSALRAVSAVTTAERTAALADRAPCAIGHVLLSWVVLPAALLKIVLGMVGWGLSLADARATFVPSWPFIATLVTFGGVGVLLRQKRAEMRAHHLGALFLLVAVAFSDRLLRGLARMDALDGLVTVLTALPLDAFIAFAFWSFVWAFPAPPLQARDRRITGALLWISFAAGVVLLAATLAATFPRTATALLGTVAPASALLARQSQSESYYALVLYGLSVPTLPYLLWKSRFEALETRRRTTLFTAALVSGLTPMLLVVVISAFIDTLSPARWPLIGTLVYLSLLSVPPLTAYAVLAHRVIDVPFLLTKAIRHALIRRALWIGSLVPLACFLLYVYSNRDVTVAEMAGDSWFLVVMLPQPLVSMLALTFHRQLLAAIDRRILGAPSDYPTILARFQRDVRTALGVRDVADIVARDLDRAVHPQIVAVLLIDQTARFLVSPTQAVRPLDARSVLGRLLQLAREEIFAGVDAFGPVGRLLPDDDRQWLTDHGFQLLMPLTGSTGSLLGVIAIGQKRSDAPFSADDRRFLSTLASQAAVVIENLALRDLPYRYLGRAGRPYAPTIAWDDEPGALCPACQRVWPADHARCECGTPTKSASLPLVIRGKFRVERLIGSGGMSLVYLATDLTLDRRVAIKTLPRLSHDRIRRLEHEARAMAAIAPHPNLAMILAAEDWREVPLVIVEYLEGGTLADRLRQRRLPAEEVIELGLVLADALDHVHHAGVLHRDIKPTNIGFTRDGVPKLLDFGVATILQPSAARARPRPAAHARERWQRFAPAAVMDRPNAATALTADGLIVGTPLYLSPEALDGADPDPSFDLWSLALVLFEATTGRNPFDAPTRQQTFDRIRHLDIADMRHAYDDSPPSLIELFEAALARDPAHRPASASELRAHLQRIRATLRPQYA